MMYFMGSVSWSLCCIVVCNFGRLIFVICVVQKCGFVLFVYMGRFEDYLRTKVDVVSICVRFYELLGMV